MEASTIRAVADPHAGAHPVPLPDDLQRLHDDVVTCRRCPRLVEWRERVAREKRASYADWDYWGRPVPGFGDPDARLLIVGLAPAAHGANRTGRMFTGDRSGDWLYRSMHRAGFANQTTSEHRDDGLALSDAWITASVRCAPPGNQPLPVERDHCFPYLRRELVVLPRVQVVLALGGFAYQNVWRLLGSAGADLPRRRPAFGHGVEVPASPYTVICSYHPSQQNTFTGKLTEPMLDGVFIRARELLA